MTLKLPIDKSQKAKEYATDIRQYIQRNFKKMNPKEFIKNRLNELRNIFLSYHLSISIILIQVPTLLMSDRWIATRRIRIILNTKPSSVSSSTIYFILKRFYSCQKIHWHKFRIQNLYLMQVNLVRICKNRCQLQEFAIYWKIIISNLNNFLHWQHKHNGRTIKNCKISV